MTPVPRRTPLPGPKPGRQAACRGAAANISLRFGADVLITPSGVDYDDLAPKMILVQALDADHVAGPAPKFAGYGPGAKA